MKFFRYLVLSFLVVFFLSACQSTSSEDNVPSGVGPSSPPVMKGPDSPPPLKSSFENEADQNNPDAIIEEDSTVYELPHN